MNRKECVIFITASLLFTSCATKSLRSDIKEFIASFSFEETVNTHQQGGYESIRENNTQDYIFKEIIVLNYSYVDNSKLEYDYHLLSYHNDEKYEEIHNYLEYVDEKIYYVTSEGKEEYDLKKSTDLISTFFYKEYYEETKYHYGGMYYGDLIIEMATTWQDWITIDSKKEFLTYDYKSSGTSKEGESQSAQEIIKVDRLGLLNFLSVSVSTGQYYTTQTITVF